MTDLLILIRNSVVLAASESQAEDKDGKHSSQNLSEEVQEWMSLDVFIHVALSLEVGLGHVLLAVVANHTEEFDIFEMFLSWCFAKDFSLFEVGIWHEVNYALLTRLPRRVNFLGAIFAAETMRNINLVESADRTCKSAVPDEVKDTLVLTIVITNCNQLREVIDLTMTLWIALILDMRLVATIGFGFTPVTLSVDNLIATLFVIVVDSHVQELATQVLEHSMVLQMTVVLKWVNAFAALVVAVQVSASTLTLIIPRLLNKETEDEASLHLLGAQILKASGMEVFLFCEEEQVFVASKTLTSL